MLTRNRTSWLLVAPLLILILAGFVVPIAISVLRAVQNPEIALALPRTTLALKAWDGTGLPPEPVYAALAEDMQAKDANKAFGAMTRRVNFETTGMRSVLSKTRNRADRLTPPFAQSLPALDAAWADPATWRILKQHSGRFTATYLLRALDLRYSETGQIVAVDREQAIFVQTFIRTFVMSLIVTAITVVLGYPTAWFMSTLKGRAAMIAMLCVLLPFWISILVRSTAWFIVLQREGVLNGALLKLGLIDQPQAIIFTRPAVYIAMVHVLLPFFILPLLGVMTRIRGDYVRAAASMGARPWQQFLHVYLPLTMPGVSAGALIVFMLSVGFYITPALVGGLRDQMIGYYIDYFSNNTINLGMAAALSTLLLIFTGLLLAVAGRRLPLVGKSGRS